MNLDGRLRGAMECSGQLLRVFVNRIPVPPSCKVPNKLAQESVFAAIEAVPKNLMKEANKRMVSTRRKNCKLSFIGEVCRGSFAGQ